MDQFTFNKYMTEFLNSYYAQKNVQVMNATKTNRDQLYTFDITLDNAVKASESTYRIEKPFKGISFEDGTDKDTFVYVVFDAALVGKSYKKFKQNSGLNCETMFNGCTIYFPAQTGKKITCTIYYDCEYTSGSLINSGTVSVSPSSSGAEIQVNGVTAATTGTISTSDPTQKGVYVQNDTSDDLWVQFSSSPVNGKGRRLTAGAGQFFATTAALYYYAVGAGKINGSKEF